MNNKVPRSAILEIAIFAVVFSVVAYFAGREVYHLLVNLWHHSHLWILIPAGIIVVPFLLYALAFVVGFVVVLVTGKK